MIPVQPSNASPVPFSPSQPRLQRMLGLMSLPILTFFILPLIALFLRITPGEFLAYLNQTQVIQAVLLSLFTTVAATLVSIVLGTPLAYAIGRGCFRYPRLVDTLIDLPLVLPPAVAGVALLMTFGRRGLLGGALDLLGIQIPFTPLAVVMAQTFVSASFYIKSAALGFSSIDPELEQAAGLDGASNWQTFRFVVVPLS